METSRCGFSLSRKGTHSPSEERDLGADGVLFQLVESAGSESVGADERDLEPSSLIVSRELQSGVVSANTGGGISPPGGGFAHLCAGGGLSGTLESDHHDDLGFALDRLRGIGIP